MNKGNILEVEFNRISLESIGEHENRQLLLSYKLDQKLLYSLSFFFLFNFRFSPGFLFFVKSNFVFKIYPVIYMVGQFYV